MTGEIVKESQRYTYELSFNQSPQEQIEDARIDCRVRPVPANAIRLLIDSRVRLVQTVQRRVESCGKQAVQRLCKKKQKKNRYPEFHTNINDAQKRKTSAPQATQTTSRMSDHYWNQNDRAHRGKTYPLC